MGALGGVIYLGVAAVMYPNSKVEGLAHVNYQPLFMVVSAIMFVAIAVLFLTIKEPKLVAEQQKLESQHPEWNLAEDDGSGNETLPKPVKKSLIFLLSSICLWFVGYNAVETWFTTYVSQVMGQALGGASTCLLIATGGAVISYIPIGVIDVYKRQGCSLRSRACARCRRRGRAARCGGRSRSFSPAAGTCAARPRSSPGP